MRKFAQQNFNGKNGLHVEIEEKYIKDMESNNIPCIQADITNLSFPSKCVDFVISTHTIEHFNANNIKNIFNEVKKMLKPGGIFFCEVPHANLHKFPDVNEVVNLHLSFFSIDISKWS